MQKYALFIFWWNIMGFLRPFFFWKFNFCPFQWGIALYETVNNSRDIIFKSWRVKNTKTIGEDNVILQRHLFLTIKKLEGKCREFSTQSILM